MCAIMSMPNNLEYLKKASIFTHVVAIPFLSYQNFFEFSKNADSFKFWYRVILAFSWLFGDNWSLAFFGALASVGALFIALYKTIRIL